jgi:hypothetical protein
MAFLFIGCATGNSFDHMRKDGSILRVERAGATGIMTSGTTRTEFHDCDSAGQNCQLVDTNKTANQSIMGQMATPAAIAYGSKEIGDGLSDSGTTVNANATGGNGAAMSVSGSTAKAVTKGGCRGNCN